MGSDWLLHVKSNTNQIGLIGLHIETINGIVSPHVYMFLYNKVNHSHILIGSYLWFIKNKLTDDVTIDNICFVIIGKN